MKKAKVIPSLTTQRKQICIMVNSPQKPFLTFLCFLNTYVPKMMSYLFLVNVHMSRLPPDHHLPFHRQLGMVPDVCLHGTCCGAACGAGRDGGEKRGSRRYKLCFTALPLGAGALLGTDGNGAVMAEDGGMR